MDKLIKTLLSRRRQWPRIAEDAEVALSTIYRIIRGATSPTQRTVDKLMAAAKKRRKINAPRNPIKLIDG